MSNQFKPEIKSLISIHTILLSGQIIMLLLFYFLAGKLNNGGNPEFFKALQFVAAFVAISSVTAAFVIFKKKVTQLQLSDSNLSERLALYRAACILKFALIEGPVVFSVIAYFIFPNASFIVLAGILIVLFAMQRPTIPMLMHDIGADRDDFFE
jgi:hypothetical protein